MDKHLKYRMENPVLYEARLRDQTKTAPDATNLSCDLISTKFRLFVLNVMKENLKFLSKNSLFVGTPRSCSGSRFLSPMPPPPRRPLPSSPNGHFLRRHARPSQQQAQEPHISLGLLPRGHFGADPICKHGAALDEAANAGVASDINRVQRLSPFRHKMTFSGGSIPSRPIPLAPPPLSGPCVSQPIIIFHPVLCQRVPSPPDCLSWMDERRRRVYAAAQTLSFAVDL